MGVRGIFYRVLFFHAELVLAYSAEGALEIVADFFPLLALLVFIKDPATDFTNIFHVGFLLIFGVTGRETRPLRFFGRGGVSPPADRISYLKYLSSKPFSACFLFILR